MNKNTMRGLIILIAMILVAVVLWRVYLAGPPQVSPGPAHTSKPSGAPSPLIPEATPPAKTKPPGTPLLKPESPQGIAPLKEPIPPAPQITIPPSSQRPEHYGVLVGSYPNYPDAAKMLEKLKKQGKPAFVQRDPRQPNLFQVWLGPFSSHDEARAAQKALRGKLKKSFKIEQIENPVPK